MTNEITPFNYEGLPEREAREIREAAFEIRGLLKRSAQDIVTIGQKLTETKAKLKHGEFIPWIEAEFKMTDQTARNFMRVAERFSGKSKMILDLPPTALYELAAPSTPEPVRAQVEARVEAGEDVTAAEIRRLKAEAKAATSRAEAAEVKSGDLATSLSLEKAELAEAFETAKAECQHAAEMKLAHLVAEHGAKLGRAQAENDRLKTEMQASREIAAEEAARAKAEAEAEGKKLAKLIEEQARAEADGITADARAKAQAALAEAEAKAAAAEKRAVRAVREEADARATLETHYAEMRRRESKEGEAQSLISAFHEFSSQLAGFAAFLAAVDRDHSDDPRIMGWCETVAKGVEGLPYFLRNEACRVKEADAETEIIDRPRLQVVPG